MNDNELHGLSLREQALFLCALCRYSKGQEACPLNLMRDLPECPCDGACEDVEPWDWLPILEKRIPPEETDDRTNNSPDVVMADIDEILRLRAEVRSLRYEILHQGKEIDWLAERCHEFCDDHNYCNECAQYSGPYSDCGEVIEKRFEKHVVENWREAARKAVDKCNAHGFKTS